MSLAGMHLTTATPPWRDTTPIGHTELLVDDEATTASPVGDRVRRNQADHLVAGGQPGGR